MDALWGLRPDDPPQEAWRVAIEDTLAHLFAYGDPSAPRCEARIEREDTRRAVHGDPLCSACMDWYMFEVELPRRA